MAGKAKNVRIIVRQLPTKAGWWDSTLALQSFSRSIALAKNSNYMIADSISPIIVLKFLIHHIRMVKVTYVKPSREQTQTSAIEQYRANH